MLPVPKGFLFCFCKLNFLRAAGFGTMSAWCDVDFYPNGGQQQPGCKDPVSNALDDIAALKVVGEVEHALILDI